MSDAHPSFLSLDEYAISRPTASNVDGGTGVGIHVTKCDQCQAHLARLELKPSEAHLSTDARRRAERERVDRGRPRWLSWRPQLGLAVVAIAGLLLFFVIRTPSDSGDQLWTSSTMAKGGASANVFVKRGESVHLWDGQMTVRENDRLRIAVTSDQHREVAVFLEVAKEGSEDIALLYHGPLSMVGTTVLPKTWRIDGAAEPEVLIVVTGETPLDLDRVRATLTRRGVVGLTADAVWAKRIILPKK